MSVSRDQRIESALETAKAESGGWAGVIALGLHPLTLAVVDLADAVREIEAGDGRDIENGLESLGQHIQDGLTQLATEVGGIG